MIKFKRFFILSGILQILLFFSIFESQKIFSLEIIDLNFSFILRSCVLLANVVVLNSIFYFLYSRKILNINKIVKYCIIAVYSFLMIFYLLEGFFTFYPKSHSTGNTALSNVSWSKYYGYPKNEYNFRGSPIGDLTGKKKIYVIGDSYTCGWGINDADDRYPEILEEKLGGDYRVINMGVPGFSIKEKLYVLHEFIDVYPMEKPELIILQYLVNDIIDPSVESNLETYPIPNIISKYFVMNSFLFNYIYWSSPRSFNDDYTDYLISSHWQENFWIEKHLHYLVGFVQLCKEKEIPLIVVGFPFLNSVDKTCPIVSSVGQIFSNFDTEFINTCEFIQGIPKEKLEVHCNDNHPSIYLHRLIASKLYERIKQSNF